MMQVAAGCEKVRMRVTRCVARVFACRDAHPSRGSQQAQLETGPRLAVTEIIWTRSEVPGGIDDPDTSDTSGLDAEVMKGDLKISGWSQIPATTRGAFTVAARGPCAGVFCGDPSSSEEGTSQAVHSRPSSQSIIPGVGVGFARCQPHQTWNLGRGPEQPCRTGHLPALWVTGVGVTPVALLQWPQCRFGVRSSG
jgi:hypothetical protein